MMLTPPPKKYTTTLLSVPLRKIPCHSLPSEDFAPSTSTSYHLPTSGSPLSSGKVLRKVSFKRTNINNANTTTKMPIAISTFFNLLFGLIFSIDAADPPWFLDKLNS